MSREELRSKVAVAFEEPTLFSASVKDNVLLGMDEQELDRALSVAQADFAHATPPRHRHPGRRTGPQPLRRPAPTPRPRTGRGRQAQIPRPRRPPVRAGRAHRGRRGGSAARCPRGHHRAHRGAPPLDRAARRPRRCCPRAASPPWAPTTNCCARTPSTPTSCPAPGKRRTTTDDGPHHQRPHGGRRTGSAPAQRREGRLRPRRPAHSPARHLPPAALAARPDEGAGHPHHVPAAAPAGGRAGGPAAGRVRHRPRGSGVPGPTTAR